jgi:uncharacterized protein YicC (UPF0701 family)
VVQEYQAKLTSACRKPSAARRRPHPPEVGLFAVRIDVAEELNRLSTHLDEWSASSRRAARPASGWIS